MSNFPNFISGGRYGMHSGSGRFKNAQIDNLLIVAGGQITPATAGVIWHVDGNRSASGDGKSWNTAFITIQEAHDAAATMRGDIILIAPIIGDTLNTTTGANYASRGYGENVLVTKEGLHFLGVGHGRRRSELRPVDATTKYPFTGEIGGNNVAAFGFVVLARNTTIENLSFDCTTNAAWGETSGDAAGIYIGDGYRIDTAYAYDCSDTRIINCCFSYGDYGIYLDGSNQQIEIAGCSFYRTVNAGIKQTPGGIMTNVGTWIHDCYFQATRVYGIDVYSHTGNKYLTIGPNNTFAEGVTDMTNPIIIGSAAGKAAIVGNYMCTTNEASGGADNLTAGNYHAVGTLAAALFVVEHAGGDE